jgi:plastocyanin
VIARRVDFGGLEGSPNVARVTDKAVPGRIRTMLSAVAISVIVLAGCGGGSDESESEPAGPARVVDITAKEYSFNGDPGTIAAGDTITFVVSNTGVEDHQMQVLDGDGRRIDQTDRILPGASDEVTVTFEEAGPYRLICDIDDHLSRGQTAGLTVVES